MAIDNDTNVLTIAEDDSALHVGRAEYAAIHFGGAGSSTTAIKRASTTTIEHYDPTGQRLRMVKVAGGWGVAADGSPPVPEQILLDRVDTALRHMQAVLEEQGGGTRLAPVIYEGDVPRPTGPLPAVLSKLSVEFEYLIPSPSRGNWLHQLAHAAGLAH